MHRTFRFVFALLFISSAFLIAQDDPRIAKLDSLITILEDENQVRGSFCIRQSGELWMSGDFGDQNKESLYRIGSISKTFTSALVLKASEAELLQLDEPIIRWFPKLPHAENISLRMLLNHRSGIHNFTNDPSYAAIMYTEQSREAMLQRIALLEPDFAPDSDFNYSNTNYLLASYILEDVYEKSLSDILSEHLSDALKLKNTYIFEPQRKSENEVDSYYWTGEWQKMGRTHPSIPLGAGAIASKPLELCLFMEALHQGDFISQKSLEEMKSSANYGLGLMRFPFYDRMAFGHNGGIDGFQSHASYFSEEDMSIAVCLNGAQYPLNDLLVDLLSIYFEKKDYSLPEFTKISLEEEQLQQYIGVYKSSNFPLDIEVLIKNGELYGQASGQGAFPLSRAGKEHHFEFKAGGIKMIFNPEENYFDFEQGATKLRFKR